MTKIRIELELDRCIDPIKDLRCPYADEKSTKGYGYAVNHVCTKMGGRITSGYVEWVRDINPIPDWCPIIVK